MSNKELIKAINEALQEMNSSKLSGEQIEEYKVDCGISELSNMEIVDEAIEILINEMNRKSDGFRRIEKISLVAIYNLLKMNKKIADDFWETRAKYRETLKKIIQLRDTLDKFAYADVIEKLDEILED